MNLRFRGFGIYIGINQNLSKLSKLISFTVLINWYCLILPSHSSSSSLLSFTLPLIGISIAERLRDRGFDSIICFDDCSKHSKSYRQISLIIMFLSMFIDGGDAGGSSI